MGRNGVVAVGLAVVLALAAGSPADAADVGLDAYRTAQNEAGRLRMLTQQIAREYLLYTYDRLDARGPYVTEAARRFDATLTQLRSGDAIARIPAPPNPAVARQLDVVTESWQTLRPLLRRNPVARRNAAVPAVAAGTPIQPLERVDQLAAQLLLQAENLVEQYVRACSAAGHPDCSDVVSLVGRQRMLAEGVTKELLFVVLEREPDVHRKRLAEVREAFAANLASVRAHQPAPRWWPPFLGTIEGYWGQLQDLVDRTVDDNGGVSVPEVLEVQGLLLNELDRFVARIERSG